MLFVFSDCSMHDVVFMLDKSATVTRPNWLQNWLHFVDSVANKFIDVSSTVRFAVVTDNSSHVIPLKVYNTSLIGNFEQQVNQLSWSMVSNVADVLDSVRVHIFSQSADRTDISPVAVLVIENPEDSEQLIGATDKAKADCIEIIAVGITDPSHGDPDAVDNLLATMSTRYKAVHVSSHVELLIRVNEVAQYICMSMTRSQCDAARISTGASRFVLYLQYVS